MCIIGVSLSEPYIDHDKGPAQEIFVCGYWVYLPMLDLYTLSVPMQFKRIQDLYMNLHDSKSLVIRQSSGVLVAQTNEKKYELQLWKHCCFLLYFTDPHT